jgi:pimeloyl-ACP methyl ester carboxylesterase
VPQADPVTTTFSSGGEMCEAWLFRPDPVPAAERAPCVVMANGLSLTRWDGLPAFARAFADAGANVLLFDHRFLGGSGGARRGLVRIGKQLSDWRAAVAAARALDGVDPERIVTWGFSLAGGHAATTAAGDARIAGYIGLCPMLDGLARVMVTPPGLAAKLTVRGIAELAGAARPIKVTGRAGETAIMTLPGEAGGFARAVPGGSPWINVIYPALLLRAPVYRPVRHAARFARPAYLDLGESDISVSNPAIERFAQRAPDATLHRFEGDHFDPLIGELAGRLAAGQAEWLDRHIVSARP